MMRRLVVALGLSLLLPAAQADGPLRERLKARLEERRASKDQPTPASL